MHVQKKSLIGFNPLWHTMFLQFGQYFTELYALLSTVFLCIVGDIALDIYNTCKFDYLTLSGCVSSPMTTSSSNPSLNFFSNPLQYCLTKADGLEVATHSL